MAYIINLDFVRYCKDLFSKGYTYSQIAVKAKKEFELKSCSVRTVSRALKEGYKKTQHEPAQSP